MKHIPLLAVALLCSTAIFVPAAEIPETQSLTYGFDWMPWSNLQGQVNHLNRMVGHVRWQFTRYHSDKAMQHEYWQIRHEIDQLNVRFKKGGYDHSTMRRDIERLHGRLHDLEVRLRVKKNDYYHWR
jgi:hypothetical protein